MVKVSVRVAIVGVRPCACHRSNAFRFSKQTAVAGSDRQLRLLWRLGEQRHRFMSSSVTQWGIKGGVLVTSMILQILLHFALVMLRFR